MADEHKSPFQQALDLLVYAPLGLAYTAMDELPTMVDKGRQRFGNQLMVARMIGQFAVVQGQKEAEKVAGRLAGQAGTVASRLGGFPGVPGPTEGAAGAARGACSAAATARAGVPSDSAVTAARNGRSAHARTGAATNGSGSNGSAAVNRADGPSADDLAIPGYDSLSASQVVQRLAGLSGTELEAVRRYETATRGRRTILSKVDQLQSDRR
ncbi:MAG TPA: hypothetical protein VGI06_02230 [Acidimicrobiales bacterium]